MLPKESKPKKGFGGKSSWHWLYKHPVEFSKNNRTRSRTALGATAQTYPVDFVMARSEILLTSPKCFPHGTRPLESGSVVEVAQ